MKHVLLFGAGKSSTVLIEYLKELAETYQYNVIVADGCFENAQSKVGEQRFVKAVRTDVKNENGKKKSNNTGRCRNILTSCGASLPCGS